MHSAIVVHPDFDKTWPFAADHFHALWKAQGVVDFLRLPEEERRPLGEIIPQPQTITRLAALGVPVTVSCLDRLSALKEAVFTVKLPEGASERLQAAGVKVYRHTSEGFWGQSVAEFGLALTL